MNVMVMEPMTIDPMVIDPMVIDPMVMEGLPVHPVPETRETLRIGNYDYLIHENADRNLVKRLQATAQGQIVREMSEDHSVPEKDDRDDDRLYGCILFLLGFGFITLL